MRSVSLSQRSFGAGIYQNNQPDTSSTLSQPPASSSASNHSASHSHSQQQHCNMATLSPSKARASFACGPTSINQKQHSPHPATLVPRSVLPESNYQGLTNSEPYTLSSSALHVFHAMKNHIAHDSALSVSVGNSHQGMYMHVIARSLAHINRDQLTGCKAPIKKWPQWAVVLRLIVPANPIWRPRKGHPRPASKS